MRVRVYGLHLVRSVDSAIGGANTIGVRSVTVFDQVCKGTPAHSIKRLSADMGAKDVPIFLL